MDSVLSNEVARRIAADLATIVSEAEKHGTLPRIKSVAFYFNETELRTIIKFLRSCRGVLDPAQRAPNSDKIREMAAWLIALGDADDHKPIPDSLITWARVYVNAGLTEKHSGDCTNESHSCVVCGVSNYMEKAEQMLKALAEFDAARPPAAPVETVREQAYSSIETCYDCGVDEPCGEDCPNYQEQEPPDNDRETRTGAHLLQMAKSLGWPDDGEGALEFMLRRAREVAFEDCGHQRSSAASEQEIKSIVSRLRNFAIWNNRHSHYEPVPLCKEAADLIERIRAVPQTSGETLADKVMADPAILHLRECSFQSAAKFESTLRAAIMRASSPLPRPQHHTGEEK